jgi:hypothetical protein
MTGGGRSKKIKLHMVAARAAVVRGLVKNFAFGRSNPLKISPKIPLLRGSRTRRKPKGASSFFVALMSDNPGQPRLGKHGGPRTKGQRSAKIMPSGGRRDYILARLERDGRHDLASAIREGRVSALTIAVELGWTKRPEALGTGSSNAARRRHFQLKTLAGDGLDSNQMQEFWLGPSHNGSYFGSREELEQAWEANRDEVMRLFANNGRRPQAWWCLDAPSLNLKYPGYDREQSYLFEAGACFPRQNVLSSCASGGGNSSRPRRPILR